ncbi:MAG: hypothetical protein ACFFCW_10460 [Candidatus Hodarchaeota archaeon]
MKKWFNKNWLILLLLLVTAIFVSYHFSYAKIKNDAIQERNETVEMLRMEKKELQDNYWYLYRDFVAREEDWVRGKAVEMTLEEFSEKYLKYW